MIKSILIVIWICGVAWLWGFWSEKGRQCAQGKKQERTVC